MQNIHFRTYQVIFNRINFATETSKNYFFLHQCYYHIHNHIVYNYHLQVVLTRTFIQLSLMYCAVLCLFAQSCLTLCDPMDCSPPGSSVHGIPQARILEWVAMPSSRGIFPTQGSNPVLLHCRQIPYRLSHKRSQRMEWVAYPFSKASSGPRNQIWVSCITGRFSTN